jgi:hypothetical protein
LPRPETFALFRATKNVFSRAHQQRIEEGYRAPKTTHKTGSITRPEDTQSGTSETAQEHQRERG